MSERLDRALDALEHGRGEVQVQIEGGSATIDVVDVGRLGVRVRRVRVRSDGAVGIAERAANLPNRLRALPERVLPVEVDPGLGGAVLRSRPDEMRDREYFEVRVHGPHEVEVKRLMAEPDGGRRGLDWAMTREGLDRLVEELG